MPTDGPARDRQQQRVAEMLRHLGLASNVPPLVGVPGSILRGPVSSPRYEADLVQLQRATRAEAKSRVPGAGTFVELKPNPPKLDGPTSLPKLVYKDDAGRHAHMRRESEKTPPHRETVVQEAVKLPKCTQDFLKGRLSAVDPADISLHRGGGGIPHWVGSSVTYGDDIHLTKNMFDRRDINAMEHKFHEIAHADQNARMGLNSFDHVAAYLGFGSHDGSPIESAADDFARKMRRAYAKAGLAKKCPF